METNKTEQAWLRRIQFLCKRGNLETELLLTSFTKCLLQKDTADRYLFEKLLLESDQDLFNWLLRETACSARTVSTIPQQYQQLVMTIRNNYLIANQ